tara:strand:- start:1886 stop:2809 length:924 start_codon:yes stop_codon:yes gene_type:complete
MIVTLRNNTGVPQSIVYKGQQIVLDASAESSFDEEVAKKFIENRSPLVSLVEETPDSYDGGAEMIWVANFTGNQDLPETVNVKQWASGRWTHAEIPNPRREVRVIERFMDQGMQGYTARDGVFEFNNLPKTRFRLPPHTRRAFPKNLANWSLKRDAISDLRGSIMKSRAPTLFEPDESWSLDDARGYLRLIDPSANVGPSESDVARKAAQDPEAVRAGDSGVRAYVTNAKKTILRRLFFRVADPQYHLPTREEFNEFMRGEAPVNKSDADAVMDMLVGSAEEVKKVKRGRGRPPGSKNKPKTVSPTP